MYFFIIITVYVCVGARETETKGEIKRETEGEGEIDKQRDRM